MIERYHMSTDLTLMTLMTILLLSGCGHGTQSTPEGTMNTLKTAVENKDWDKLYSITHPKLRAHYLQRWRSDLKHLLEEHDSVTDVGPDDIDTLSNRQIFRTYLEIISRDSRSKAVINAYQGAEYTLDNSGTDPPVINVKSSRPLPIENIELTKEANQWVIRNVD